MIIEVLKGHTPKQGFVSANLNDLAYSALFPHQNFFLRTLISVIEHFLVRMHFSEKMFVLLRGYNSIICCDIELKFCTKFDHILF